MSRTPGKPFQRLHRNNFHPTLVDHILTEKLERHLEPFAMRLGAMVTDEAAQKQW